MFDVSDTVSDQWVEELSIHSGVTCNAPVLAVLRGPLVVNRTFEGQDGFYIHLRGSYNLTQQLVMSFAAFNLAKAGKLHVVMRTVHLKTRLLYIFSLFRLSP